MFGCLFEEDGDSPDTAKDPSRRLFSLLTTRHSSIETSETAEELTLDDDSEKTLVALVAFVCETLVASRLSFGSATTEKQKQA